MKLLRGLTEADAGELPEAKPGRRWLGPIPVRLEGPSDRHLLWHPGGIVSDLKTETGLPMYRPVINDDGCFDPHNGVWCTLTREGLYIDDAPGPTERARELAAAIVARGGDYRSIKGLCSEELALLAIDSGPWWLMVTKIVGDMVEALPVPFGRCASYRGKALWPGYVGEQIYPTRGQAEAVAELHCGPIE